ncbi:MAG: EAL domain-containing protein [Kurthia sp.]|nr:EAL domain-containing protein [Candidatus Kurthia equi]
MDVRLIMDNNDSFFKKLTSSDGHVRPEIIEAIFYNISEGIMLTDENKIILSVNPAFEIVTGFLATEAVGSNPRLLQSGMHTKDFYMKMWDTIDQCGRWSGEIWNRRKTGAIYPEWLTVVAIKNSAGEVTNYCGVFEDLSEKKIAEREIQIRTNTDTLTGTENSYSFANRMEALLKASKEKDFTHALLFLDMDRFAQINESLGHSVGDQILVEVVERLTPLIRNKDILARYGGDEFVIALSNLHHPKEALQFSENIIKLFEEPFIIDEHTLYLSASIGISLYPHDGENTELLISKAVKAMEHAKKSGRNQYAFYFEDLKLDKDNGLLIDHELRKAIKKEEFELHFQPKIDLATQTISGFEALVRWTKSKLGFVSPDVFIPHAEETGLIIPLSEIIIEKACLAWLEMNKMGYGHMNIAINISSIHFHQANFVDSLRKILEKNNCSPHHFELELTERTVMNNEDEIIRRLLQLKEMGFKLSIDDFGTGYSSLSYLVQFPLNYLKIDRSFIQFISTAKEKQAVVDAIIQMAHRLNMEVIAEGAEQIEQVELLRNMGCDMIQGYYYSKPLPLDEAKDYLEYWKLETEGK